MFAPGFFPKSFFPAAWFGGAALTELLADPGARPLVASFFARDFLVTFHDHPLMPRHVIWTIGETREPIRLTLYHTVAGVLEPLPLGGSTVTAHLKGIATGTELLDVPCAVVNAAAVLPTDADCGEVTIALAGLAAAVADDYQVRFKADFGGGVVQWWPTAGHLVATARPPFTVA